MKLHKHLFAFITFVAFMPTAHSEAFTVEGHITHFRVHDGGYRPDWADSAAWIHVENATHNGACAVSSEGNTYLRIRPGESSLYSAVLAAHLAGRRVAVGFNDANVDQGMCVVDIIDILP